MASRRFRRASPAGEVTPGAAARNSKIGFTGEALDRRCALCLRIRISAIDFICGYIIISDHIVGYDKSTADIDLGHGGIIPSLSHQATVHAAASFRVHVTLGLSTFARSSYPRLELFFKYEFAKYEFPYWLTCTVIQKDRFDVFQSLSQWHAAVDTLLPDFICVSDGTHGDAIPHRSFTSSSGCSYMFLH